MSAPQRVSLPLLPTGVPGLDAVLGGGLPEFSFNLLSGTPGAGKKMLRFHRPYITMRFGKPYMLPPIDRKDRDASLQRNTDEIMCRIAALIPPEYRGVYANHPRLKQLLESNPG